MKTQIEYCHAFKALHVKGDPLILWNIWDAASAQAISEANATAIATSSWAVAATQGYTDGQYLPFDFVLTNTKQIVNAVDLPVSIDFEAGYATDLTTLKENSSRLIKTGIAGINFEDQIIGEKRLYRIADQCERIRAIRHTAIDQSIPLFINARSDLFFIQGSNTQADPAQALERAIAYADAGADCLFLPGLENITDIAMLCERSPIPINIMLTSLDNNVVTALKNIGVSRISYGPYPFLKIMQTLQQQAQV